LPYEFSYLCRKAVNEFIRNLIERPEVYKYETHENWKTTRHKIEVKGKIGQFTIS
jgi:hypothetical protein